MSGRGPARDGTPSPATGATCAPATTAPTDGALPAGVVVAWATAAAPDRELVAWLDGHERSRLQRLRRPDDRARFATGRGLARALLAPVLGVAPAAVPLEVQRTGRPVVPGTGVDLSIAHAGPHVLVAVADGGRRVGVDVEGGTGAPLPDDGLLAVVCTPAERAALAEADGPALGGPALDGAAPRNDGAARRDAFLRLWTAKEAVLKADGRGLLVDPTTVEIATDGPPRLVHGPGNGTTPTRVTLRVLPAPEGYRAALAVVAAPDP